MWVGGGEMVPNTHMHMYTYTCTHTCTYDIIGNSQGFPQCIHMHTHKIYDLHEIIMFTTCTCACACVWGAPPNHPPPHPSNPQTTPHTHPSNPPTPRAAGSRKHRNSISLELIEIIRFCLKILYL